MFPSVSFPTVSDGFLVFSKVATSLRMYPGVSKGCHVFSNAVRKNIGNLVDCAATGRGMGGRAAIYQSPLAVVGGRAVPYQSPLTVVRGTARTAVLMFCLTLLERTRLTDGDW